MKNNKTRLGIIGLLLMCPLAIGCSNDNKMKPPEYLAEYKDFSIKDYKQLPNNPNDYSYQYEFTVKNNGSGYIEYFDYAGTYQTCGINRETLKPIPVNELFLLQPGASTKMVVSYQPRENSVFDVTNVVSEAYVYPAYNVKVNGTLELTKTPDSPAYDISCTIDLYEAGNYYNYIYIATLEYNSVEYAFRVYPSDYNKLTFSVDLGFDESLAKVKNVAVFKEKDTQIDDRDNNIDRTKAGDIFVIILASLAFGATATLVTYEVIKFIKNKK